MSEPFVCYFIHNSHTDVGCTDYQEKVEKYHIYYIREAIESAKETSQGFIGFPSFTVDR